MLSTPMTSEESYSVAFGQNETIGVFVNSKLSQLLKAILVYRFTSRVYSTLLGQVNYSTGNNPNEQTPYCGLPPLALTILIKQRHAFYSMGFSCRGPIRFSSKMDLVSLK